MGGIHTRARPVDPTGRIEFGQQRLMQPVEHPGLGPVSSPPPAGHPGTEPELLGQVLPADPGVEHEQNPLQHQPIRQPLRSRPTRRPNRQQRREPRPQLVRDNPGRSHTTRSSQSKIINVLRALTAEDHVSGVVRVLHDRPNGAAPSMVGQQMTCTAQGVTAAEPRHPAFTRSDTCGWYCPRNNGEVLSGQMGILSFAVRVWEVP
jgi:hypothetical protein